MNTSAFSCLIPNGWRRAKEGSGAPWIDQGSNHIRDAAERGAYVAGAVAVALDVLIRAHACAPDAVAAVALRPIGMSLRRTRARSASETSCAWLPIEKREIHESALMAARRGHVRLQ